MTKSNRNYEQELNEIMTKVERGEGVSKIDVLTLLTAHGEEELELLHLAARKTREKNFQDKVFLYGFVYFSTYCRNSCNFCYYRNANTIERYRKTPEETIEVARKLADSGVHLIDLTMGEDPEYHREDFRSIIGIAEKTRRETGLPVMISSGLVRHDIIDGFAEVGSEWYALYQETHNRDLFQRLRIRQSYDERMEAKLYAKSKGMHIEEGILVGIGETLEDIADSILAMGEEGVRQMRVMSFVPQKGIPMEDQKTPPRELEFKVISAMRILYPKALIPASLDVDGISGLRSRMDAGANVITSIIPPMEGLMGVAQNKKDVDDGGRSVAEVISILETMGLRSATKEEYMDFCRN